MPTSIRLSETTEKRLDALAAKTGRTKAYYIREAVEEHLDDLEDIYLAETAYEAFVKSGKTAVPLEEVGRRLGLGD